ncbi:hypothetical protein CPLU01_00321 [Colletotrichum plurivorum]|uniref:Uncharacterized protein n=1 Tax=Colletotrichum plurivorum TaxID=2175906 RepID=A0A8H6U5P6_9PEZI|nr:hypothetical protein CPLU01_00321 [Colletotrichum plurivorum]
MYSRKDTWAFGVDAGGAKVPTCLSWEDDKADPIPLGALRRYGGLRRSGPDLSRTAAGSAAKVQTDICSAAQCSAAWCRQGRAKQGHAVWSSKDGVPHRGLPNALVKGWIGLWCFDISRRAKTRAPVDCSYEAGGRQAGKQALPTADARFVLASNFVFTRAAEAQILAQR